MEALSGTVVTREHVRGSPDRFINVSDDALLRFFQGKILGVSIPWHFPQGPRLAP